MKLMTGDLLPEKNNASFIDTLYKNKHVIFDTVFLHPDNITQTGIYFPLKINAIKNNY